MLADCLEKSCGGIAKPHPRRGASIARRQRPNRPLCFESLERRDLLAVDPVGFDFENRPATTNGFLQSVTLTESGLTLEITRPGSRFDIVDNTGTGHGKPAPFGQRSLTPFAFETSNTPFIFNFSAPVNSASMLMGDYGEDSPDVLVVEAFSEPGGSGDLIAQAVDSLPTLAGDAFNFRQLTVEGTGIRSLRVLGGTPSFPNSTFIDQIMATPEDLEADLKISGAKWVPLQEREPGHRGTSAIRFQWDARDYAGNIVIEAYQSNNAKLDARDIKLVSSLSIDAGQVSTGEGIIYISDPPIRQAFNVFSPNQSPRYILLVAKPEAPTQETNQTDNLTKVKVGQPGAISYELERTAPLANTKAERVQLWLEIHRAEILDAATRFHVDATAVAGAIAWEALKNIRTITLRSAWPGKVHVSEGAFPSAAQQIEHMGYLPVQTNAGRAAILKAHPANAINYVAAIMGAFADAADRQNVEAPIRAMPEILATLYQGVSIKKRLIPGAEYYSPAKSRSTPIRPGNADAYFAYKERIGANYSANEAMGRWVLVNLFYLEQALAAP